MVVYLDVLFLKNFIMTYLVLVITAEIVKIPFLRKRVLLASLIDTLIIIWLILFDLQNSLVIKMVTLGLAVTISFPTNTVKCFFASFASAMVITFVIGGAINSSLQTPIETIIIGTFCVVAIHQYACCYKKKQWKTRNLYQLKLTIENHSFFLKAFLDTGNFLTYGMREEPVVIVSEDAIKEKISLSLRKILFQRIVPTKEYPFQKDIRKIGWKGIDETVQESFGIKIKDASIKHDFGTIKKDVIVITSPRRWSGYDALIGLSTLEGGMQDGNNVFMESKSTEIYC